MNKNSTKPDFTFIDLFAGIGGTRLGFEAAGGRCVFTSEWDVHAQKTYAANFGDTPHGDITKIESDDIPDFDVLLAGFPCQPFSSIGKREGFLHKTQGTLFNEVARIISDKRPLAFMLENVQGLVTHDKGNTLQVILDVLAELKYDVYYEILNAADYGVPQSRKRIYIVGFDQTSQTTKKIKYVFPPGNSNSVDVGSILQSDNEVDGFTISKHLQKSYLFKINDGRPKLIDKSTKGPAKTLVSSYHKIQRLTGTFVKGGPTGIRLLTAVECKRLMGFPDDYITPSSRTQMYRQFGNSVAVPVIRDIAISMRPYILGMKKSRKAPLRVKSK